MSNRTNRWASYEVDELLRLIETKEYNLDRRSVLIFEDLLKIVAELSKRIEEIREGETDES